MVATCWGSAFSGFFFGTIRQFEAMLASHHWPGNARCSPCIGEDSTPKPWPNVGHLLRFPCLCCDGPGPNDCVICSEGIDNFWHPQGVVRLRRLDWPHTIQNWRKPPVYTVPPMRSRCEPCIFPSYTRLCMLWSWQWWGWNLHGRRWKLLNHVTMCHYIGSSCWSYIFKEYDIIVDSPAGEPGSSFCGSAGEEDWCASLSFDASCWNKSRLWVPTYCLDEDEHRSLIDRSTEYKFGKDLLVLCMPFSPGRHVGWWRCFRHGRLLRRGSSGMELQSLKQQKTHFRVILRFPFCFLFMSESSRTLCGKESLWIYLFN